MLWSYSPIYRFVKNLTIKAAKYTNYLWVFQVWEFGVDCSLCRFLVDCGDFNGANGWVILRRLIILIYKKSGAYSVKTIEQPVVTRS